MNRRIKSLVVMGLTTSFALGGISPIIAQASDNPLEGLAFGQQQLVGEVKQIIGSNEVDEVGDEVPQEYLDEVKFKEYKGKVIGDLRGTYPLPEDKREELIDKVYRATTYEEIQDYLNQAKQIVIGDEAITEEEFLAGKRAEFTDRMKALEPKSNLGVVSLISLINTDLETLISKVTTFEQYLEINQQLDCLELLMEDEEKLTSPEVQLKLYKQGLKNKYELDIRQPENQTTEKKQELKQQLDKDLQQAPETIKNLEEGEAAALFLGTFIKYVVEVYDVPVLEIKETPNPNQQQQPQQPLEQPTQQPRETTTRTVQRTQQQPVQRAQYNPTSVPRTPSTPAQVAQQPTKTIAQTQRGPNNHLYDPVNDDQKTCDELIEEGKYNFQQGDPGYRTDRDKDNDGVACDFEGVVQQSDAQGDTQGQMPSTGSFGLLPLMMTGLTSLGAFVGIRKRK